MHQVVPDSGEGWQLVQVEGLVGGGGAVLRSKIPLNYEDHTHRGGLQLQVQVTDQGEGSWDDHQRTGLATVTIVLVDTNDNSPQFDGQERTIEMAEDAASGSVVTTMVATDQDEGSGGLVSYGISPPSDPRGTFAIDTGGTVRLARVLDREKTSRHVLHVLAWDSGDPPNTATGTLTVTVRDVNDNPPILIGPRVLALPELDASSPSRSRTIFNVTLDDPDDWTAGNGPPFEVKVDPVVEVALQSFLKLSHEPGIVTGEDGVVVTVTAMVEREMGGVLAVPLIVTDSGTPPLSATVTLTLARSSGDRTVLSEHKFIQVASIKQDE
ncbi:putative neural-cadherin 2 [Hyalella azteca]|uniref:Neural-cadherin 2 n=1 Tax=Hyalella azteca TaxID=294128 RepID=A0A979FVG1_HYAAZ|nr:putative neural-cadherin 2 [Hyalella azteca]